MPKIKHQSPLMEATGKTVHVIIEAVFPLDDSTPTAGLLERALDELRTHGGAEVMYVGMAADDFETASELLTHNRHK